MRSYSRIALFFIIFYLIQIHFLQAQDSTNQCLRHKPFHIVILGSSTAAGAGVSNPDSAWVVQYRHYLQHINSQNTVTNLAIGGTTTYHIMPTWYLPPPNRPSPNANNVTQAIALGADAIIVNMPSNDASNGFGVDEQMHNFHTIVNSADSANIPVWVCTTQPKANLTIAKDKIQTGVRDSIFNDFGYYAIDFWTTLALPNNKLDSVYDAGDGTHLNNAGHNTLFQRVSDKNILSHIYDTLAVEDHIISLKPGKMEPCGDTAAIFNGVITNMGIPGNYAIPVTTIINNYSDSTIQYQYLTMAGGVATCSSAGFTITVNTWNGGDFSIQSFITAQNDTNHLNDTSATIHFSFPGRPSVVCFNDTVCKGENALLSVLSNDSVFWYDAPVGGNIVGRGNMMLLPGILQDTTFWAVAKRKPFHYTNFLQTTHNANISWNGVMFDLIAYDTITIDSFALIPSYSGQQAVKAYFKYGSHHGYENQSLVWTYWGTDTVITVMDGQLTVVRFPLLTLFPGDTIGVYLSMEQSNKALRYHSISQPTVISTPELSLWAGTGVASNFGQLYFPRLWSGKVFYHYGHNSDGLCTSLRNPVMAVVSEPTVNLGNDVVLTYSPALHHILDAGHGFVDYRWSTGDTTQIIIIDSTTWQHGQNWYWVEVTNHIGCKTTDSVLITVWMTGIDDEMNDAQRYIILPNPSNGSFRISGNGEGAMNITLWNEMGQPVFNKKMVEYEEIINSHLVPGSYLCVIQQKNHYKVLPLLIQ